MIYGLEDWEFWAHMLHKDDLVSNLSNITFFYRIRKESMITLMDKKKEMEVKEYVFNKHASKYFTRFSDLNTENKKLKHNLTNIMFVFRTLIKLL